MLGIAGEIKVPLNGDHSTIVKYASENDNEFQVVSGTIANVVRAMRNIEQTHTEL